MELVCVPDARHACHVAMDVLDGDDGWGTIGGGRERLRDSHSLSVNILTFCQNLQK